LKQGHTKLPEILIKYTIRVLKSPIAYKRAGKCNIVLEARQILQGSSIKRKEKLHNFSVQ
jgi:hypothetical protein